MKKHFSLLILFLILCGNCYSQIPENIKKHYTNTFDIFTDIITDKPENFTPKSINMGFGTTASYVIPVGKSNFSFAIGGGFSFHNFHSNALPKDAIPVSLQDTTNTNDFYFMRLDSIGVSSYKRNKISIAYFDIPLELLYCAKNGIKFSIGAKLSFNIGSHSKYKGIDFVYGTNDTYKYKKYDLDNLSNFGISPVIRFGWRWVNIYASYNLISIYDATGGNKIRPISIGLSFTPGK